MLEKIVDENGIGFRRGRSFLHCNLLVTNMEFILLFITTKFGISVYGRNSAIVIECSSRRGRQKASSPA